MQQRFNTWSTHCSSNMRPNMRLASLAASLSSTFGGGTGAVSSEQKLSGEVTGVKFDNTWRAGGIYRSLMVTNESNFRKQRRTNRNSIRKQFLAEGTWGFFQWKENPIENVGGI